MANTTIYPYGTNGQLPSSIGVINDLTTGGVNQALSAEMGKEIGEKMVFLEETDKSLNIDGSFTDKLLQPAEYTKTDGYYIYADNGSIRSSSAHSYIRIDAENFRGSKLYMTGISKGGIGMYDLGYAFYNSSGTRLSGSYYGSGTTYTLTISTNTNVAYVLLSIGSNPSNFKAAWDLTYIPENVTTDYDILSANGGKRIIADRLGWMPHLDEEQLKGGLYDRLNKIDLSQSMSGYYLDVQETSVVLKQNASSKILFQKIPTGVTSVSIYGLKASSSNNWFGWSIVGADGVVKTSSKGSGTTTSWKTINVASDDTEKYIVLNMQGSSTLPYDIDDIIILYNPAELSNDSSWYIANANVVSMKHDVVTETLPTNLISTANQVSFDAGNYYYTFEFATNGEKYLYWYLPSAKIVNEANSFIQYGDSDNVLLTENIYAVGNTTNFGYYGESKWEKYQCAMVKLQSGCAKIRIMLKFSNNNDITMRKILANGNAVYLTNDRQVYRRIPRVTAIDGIKLNQYNKKPLEGLTICCLGDSITDFGNDTLGTANGCGYPKIIQSNYECCCINYGRGNSHFIDLASTSPTADTNPGTGSTGGASGSPNNVVTTQVRWMLREMSEDNITPDVVVLSGGTNDCFADVNYGTLATAMASYGTTTDAVKTTFYDAAVYMVSKIRAAFPNVKIFFGTPIKSIDTTQGARLVAWRDAMIAAAQAMGCGVIDWYAESGIVDYPRSKDTNMFFDTYSGNTVHPSVLGIKCMAKLAVSEIAKAFPT